MKPLLVAITDASGTDRFLATVSEVRGKLPKHSCSDDAARERLVALDELVDHLTWLLSGKLTEVEILRRNINSLCSTELAQRIVQD